jgi:hypothetical protein
LNHVAEPHRVEHLAITGFNVDAVVKIEAALVFDRLGNRDPCGFSRVVLGRFKVRQFNALFIWSINVIEQMEVEPRHVTENAGLASELLQLQRLTYAKGINVQQNLRQLQYGHLSSLHPAPDAAEAAPALLCLFPTQS